MNSNMTKSAFSKYILCHLHCVSRKLINGFVLSAFKGARQDLMAVLPDRVSIGSVVATPDNITETSPYESYPRFEHYIQ